MSGSLRGRAAAKLAADNLIAKQCALIRKLQAQVAGLGEQLASLRVVSGDVETTALLAAAQVRSHARLAVATGHADHQATRTAARGDSAVLAWHQGINKARHDVGRVALASVPLLNVPLPVGAQVHHCAALEAVLLAEVVQPCSSLQLPPYIPSVALITEQLLPVQQPALAHERGAAELGLATSCVGTVEHPMDTPLPPQLPACANELAQVSSLRPNVITDDAATGAGVMQQPVERDERGERDLRALVPLAGTLCEAASDGGVVAVVQRWRLPAARDGRHELELELLAGLQYEAACDGGVESEGEAAAVVKRWRPNAIDNAAICAYEVGQPFGRSERDQHDQRALEPLADLHCETASDDDVVAVVKRWRQCALQPPLLPAVGCRE